MKLAWDGGTPVGTKLAGMDNTSTQVAYAETMETMGGGVLKAWKLGC